VKVLCTLPHASELINGVKFEPIEGGMLSEDVDQSVVDHFVGIQGYEAYDPDAKKQSDADAAGDAEILKNLIAEAKALGVSVDARWKAGRLATEIDKAKERAANPAA
jgi:hypothetical protein